MRLKTITGALLVITVCCVSTSTIANKALPAESTQQPSFCGVSELDTQLNGQGANYPAGENFQLLGKAKLSVLFWDIYESQLLTSDAKVPFSSACQCILFKIRYLRAISNQELVANTEAQWQHLQVDKDIYRGYLTKLARIWPDIQAGDQLSLLSQGEITVFYFNQQKIAAIKSPTFAKLFLGIWLDKNTSEARLRQQLLGGGI
ncbi:Chalcone isomerase-like [Colwellia chukchiensis]|uniref:Chalcone isomerase-like n=1 Tax=Colwellia chukchiensis TaxID=641665 RepID=A0A1H7SWI2_9GAMM|nr:chalcone isomerase family protein [Colwellia chukchiensis]SEL76639.1 Chalcone isomerase-like [Colwellia chukchiensis]